MVAIVMNTIRGKHALSNRQQYVDRVRDLQTDVKTRLVKGKFVKEVEEFCLEEALKSLALAEKYLNDFLQIDKYHGK